MSYLQKLGHGKPNYDRFPYIAVAGYDEQCWRGWQAICARISEAAAATRGGPTVIAIECYSGVQDEEVIPELLAGIEADNFYVTTTEAFKHAEEIDALVAADLGGDDPVFGRMTRLTLADFLDRKRCDALRERVVKGEGITVVYGTGALLCCEPHVVVYADMPRWEGQLRQRRDEVDNLGVRNRELKASLQYKRSFFIDWRVCDKLKRATWKRWDFLLDTTVSNDPKLVTGDALRAGLEQTVRQPFRVVPFFDPGVWGGQWIKEVVGIDDDAPNYAWGFDCVPEENSLMLGFGDVRVEVPAINMVFSHPDELLGEPVHGRFGAEFPIRFDFLDTMQGQNLSFQVHPDVDYAREHFGLSYTQDESYYILDAGDDAEVYLGLNENVDAKRMMEDLAVAQTDATRPFPDGEHVAKWAARKHDHFLIPAGTCHCSGRNSLVLEISHTPYIFTFKLWDWARVGLDGQPRPINLERGRDVIRWERTREWVGQQLVNAVEVLEEGDGWREERTGLYQSEAIETRRHWFTQQVSHDTLGRSVHVLNLVEGREAIVESPSGAFRPFVVHYAETFIVPAAVGAYTVRPHGESIGKELATLKAFIRVNA